MYCQALWDTFEWDQGQVTGIVPVSVGVSEWPDGPCQWKGGPAQAKCSPSPYPGGRQGKVMECPSSGFEKLGVFVWSFKSWGICILVEGVVV